MTNWQPPIDHTIDVIDTEIERPNSNKVVIIHKRYHEPKYGNIGEYLDWKRKEIIVRHSGEITHTVYTERRNHQSEQMEQTENYSHTFELADDNETIPHSGKKWDIHAIDQSRKCANLRWKNYRKGKPSPKDPKEAIKEAIEADY